MRGGGAAAGGAPTDRGDEAPLARGLVRWRRSRRSVPRVVDVARQLCAKPEPSPELGISNSSGDGAATFSFIFLQVAPFSKASELSEALSKKRLLQYW